MPSKQQIDNAFQTFVSDVAGFVSKGRHLPNRIPSRLGVWGEWFDIATREVHHGARVGVEAVGEGVGHNKRKVVGTLAGTGTGTAVSTGVAVAAGAVVTGPAVGIGLGAGLAVGLAALGVMHGIRVKRYSDARKAVEDTFSPDRPGAGIDIDKLFNAVNLGGLSDLARSFEKARAAQADFNLKANDLVPEVGPSGTCFRAAEYAYRLLYWTKRASRLFADGDAADHRLRNVMLFVDLVPRKLFAEAEGALKEYGKKVVTRIATASEDPAQKTAYGNAPLTNEGLLKWAKWAPAMGTNPNWQARLAYLVERGRAAGDPKGLVRDWDRVVQALPAAGNDQEAEQRIRQAQSPALTAKPIANNQVQAPAAALTLVGKPATALVVKELLSAGLLHAALSNSHAWVSGAATGAAGIVPAAIASAVFTMLAEGLNAQLNLRDIFDPNIDPARKVWLIRDNLEAGGAAEVMRLRGLIDQSINSIHHDYYYKRSLYGSALAPMIEELYRLHQYLVQLAVQSILWEMLLALILDGKDNMLNALESAWDRFTGWMKQRLHDDGTGSFHANCKSACYRIDGGTGQPVARIFQA